MLGERLGRFEIEGEHLLGLEIRDRVVRQRDEFPRGGFNIASVWIGGVHCHLGLDSMEFVCFVSSQVVVLNFKFAGSKRFTFFEFELETAFVPPGLIVEPVFACGKEIS